MKTLKFVELLFLVFDTIASPRVITQFFSHPQNVLPSNPHNTFFRKPMILYKISYMTDVIP